MSKSVLILCTVLIAVVQISCSSDIKKEEQDEKRGLEADEYVLVADFEKDSEIFITYLEADYIAKIIALLSQYEPLVIITENESGILQAKAHVDKFGAKHDNIAFLILPHTDQWIRDSGPAILRNKKGKLKAVDFKSTKSEYDANDDQLAILLGLPTKKSLMNIQGGARESNGKGSMILCEAFFEYTDPAFDKEHTTAVLKKELGLKRIIWLKKGLIEDEAFENGPIYESLRPIGSGGHVDEFCRFVDSSTVLLAQVPDEDLEKHPLYSENHERMEENFKILSKHKDLKIIRIPTAEFVFDTLHNPMDNQDYPVLDVASYLNFIVGNKVVLAAAYYQKGLPLSVKAKDEQVNQVLREVFPEHTIVQLDPMDLNKRGGGFHCMSYNFPKKLLFGS